MLKELILCIEKMNDESIKYIFWIKFVKNSDIRKEKNITINKIDKLTNKWNLKRCMK